MTSRASSEMVVSSVLITGPRLRLDNSRTKWTLAVSVRNVRRIRNVESSNVAVGGLCLFRVLSRSRSTENSVELEPFTSSFKYKHYFHSWFRKSHRQSKGIEIIKNSHCLLIVFTFQFEIAALLWFGLSCRGAPVRDISIFWMTFLHIT